MSVASPPRRLILPRMYGGRGPRNAGEGARLGEASAPRRLRPRHPRRLSLWAPTSALVVLSLPLLLIAALIAAPALSRRGVPPGRAVLALIGLVFALSGTAIQVATPRARLNLRFI